jgi:hypothetical protein
MAEVQEVTIQGEHKNFSEKPHLEQSWRTREVS